MQKKIVGSIIWQCCTNLISTRFLIDYLKTFRRLSIRPHTHLGASMTAHKTTHHDIYLRILSEDFVKKVWEIFQKVPERIVRISGGGCAIDGYKPLIWVLIGNHLLVNKHFNIKIEEALYSGHQLVNQVHQCHKPVLSVNKEVPFGYGRSLACAAHFCVDHSGSEWSVPLFR